MKITIVAGARPNFMKIAPITRAIEAARALGKSISYRLVYTGRKDDTSLDASLFSDLDMKAPDVYLGVESSNPTSLTAGIMVAFEQELTENPAHVVLVVDDLTATMSCAIVAKKQGIKVAHLVAGTRSFDMKMPKEVNRMITDGLSDYLLMPPQNYLFFGYLINKAKGIITDSGNVAEEATFLGIPCITLNTYAEHPETWRMGTNELVGEDPALLAKTMDTLMHGEWKRGELPERWDGRTAERIVQILTSK